MKSRRRKQNQELFWPRVVMRKWLNFSAKDSSDFSADSDSDDASSSFASDSDPDPYPRTRRRKSETFRAQYISTKELRVCVGTWNVGGKVPPDDLVIDDWIDTCEPADIYVFGLQEIVPLNAGNIFGAEDCRPVQKWENIIRETLDRIRPPKRKLKCFSDPPSPTKFMPSEEVPDIEEEILLENDSDIDEVVHPMDTGHSGFYEVKDKLVTAETDLNSGVGEGCDNGKLCLPMVCDVKTQLSSTKRLNRIYCFPEEDDPVDEEIQSGTNSCKLTKMLSGTGTIGLAWPEPPLDLFSQRGLNRPNSFKSAKSFKTTKSLKTYSSFKSVTNEMQQELPLLPDLEELLKRKRRSSFVRIVSKQMVGVFLSIWVRRSLRKHIQNLKVSTVGVGVMGYIGNKGSISVSMSIYQTLFCFICSHLTSGEKDGDDLKRNADVNEIHRRTQFRSLSGVGLPKSILDHERIIWLGDLNYRINLPYDKTRELIFKKEWSKLREMDQLLQEFRKGRAFDGWSEGVINFPPTYKYETNSDKYYGEDPKSGRRTPAWCDRILSYGKGMRLLNYRRAELKLSDHRPVTATYMAEVEVFSMRKLQRALTFTEAEIEDDDYVVVTE